MCRSLHQQYACGHLRPICTTPCHVAASESLLNYPNDASSRISILTPPHSATSVTTSSTKATAGSFDEPTPLLSPEMLLTNGAMPLSPNIRRALSGCGNENAVEADRRSLMTTTSNTTGETLVDESPITMSSPVIISIGGTDGMSFSPERGVGIAISTPSPSMSSYSGTLGEQVDSGIGDAGAGAGIYLPATQLVDFPLTQTTAASSLSNARSDVSTPTRSPPPSSSPSQNLLSSSSNNPTSNILPIPSPSPSPANPYLCPSLHIHTLHPSGVPCLHCYMQPAYAKLRNEWINAYKTMHPLDKACQDPREVCRLSGVGLVPERVKLVNAFQGL